MKKSGKIIFWIGIFLIILTNILSKPLTDLDEMWNFNVARCISNGLVPYRDINMVSTPLLGFVVSIFLKIFGQEMFVTRILAVFLSLGILILIYFILKKVGIKESISGVIVLAITGIMSESFCLDYNFFTVLLALFIILLELKNNKNPKITKNILIGVLGGLCVCTKQSIGMLICFVIIINQFFFIKSKKDVKSTLKNIGFRIIGMIIPIAIFVIYLLINNAFNDFLDYCVYGISTFSNKISYSNLINSKDIIIKIFSIIMPLTIIVSVIINIVKKCLKKEDSIWYILTIYSIPIFAVAFPISDKIHLLIGILPTIILLIYSMSLLIKKIEFLKSKYVSELLDIIYIASIIVCTLYIEFTYSDTLSNLSKYRKLNHFKYITVSEYLSTDIEEINEYINTAEKKVYILDATAAVYMIPNDKYNKNYDMFLKGNLGSGGEEAQIENIKNEDALYLIMKDGVSRNWQTPENVRAYIKENLNYKGTVGTFDIYENNIRNK